MTIKFTNYLKDSRPAVGFSLDKLRLITPTYRKLWLEYQVYKEGEECHAKTLVCLLWMWGLLWIDINKHGEINFSENFI